MVNVVSLVHFKDKKVSSKFNMDAVDPYVSDRGYVRPGSFFVKLETEGLSMKLSLQEAAELVSRLDMEIKRLIATETKLKIERANGSSK